MSSCQRPPAGGDEGGPQKKKKKTMNNTSLKMPPPTFPMHLLPYPAIFTMLNVLTEKQPPLDEPSHYNVNEDLCRLSEVCRAFRQLCLPRIVRDVHLVFGRRWYHDFPKYLKVSRMTFLGDSSAERINYWKRCIDLRVKADHMDFIVRRLELDVVALLCSYRLRLRMPLNGVLSLSVYAHDCNLELVNLIMIVLSDWPKLETIRFRSAFFDGSLKLDLTLARFPNLRILDVRFAGQSAWQLSRKAHKTLEFFVACSHAVGTATSCPSHSDGNDHDCEWRLTFPQLKAMSISVVCGPVPLSMTLSEMLPQLRCFHMIKSLPCEKLNAELLFWSRQLSATCDMFSLVFEPDVDLSMFVSRFRSAQRIEVHVSQLILLKNSVVENLCLHDFQTSHIEVLVKCDLRRLKQLSLMTPSCCAPSCSVLERDMCGDICLCWHLSCEDKDENCMTCLRCKLECALPNVEIGFGNMHFWDGTSLILPKLKEYVSYQYDVCSRNGHHFVPEPVSMGCFDVVDLSAVVEGE